MSHRLQLSDRSLLLYAGRACAAQEGMPSLSIADQTPMKWSAASQLALRTLDQVSKVCGANRTPNPAASFLLTGAFNTLWSLEKNLGKPSAQGPRGLASAKRAVLIFQNTFRSYISPTATVESFPTAEMRRRNLSILQVMRPLLDPLSEEDVSLLDRPLPWPRGFRETLEPLSFAQPAIQVGQKTVSDADQPKKGNLKELKIKHDEQWTAKQAAKAMRGRSVADQIAAYNAILAGKRNAQLSPVVRAGSPPAPLLTEGNSSQAAAGGRSATPVPGLTRSSFSSFSSASAQPLLEPMPPAAPSPMRLARSPGLLVLSPSAEALSPTPALSPRAPTTVGALSPRPENSPPRELSSPLALPAESAASFP